MKIVILGAGYEGVFSAANLSKHEDMEVLLIDKNPYHQLLQQIHHVASGTKRPDEIIFSIRGPINLPLSNRLLLPWYL